MVTQERDGGGGGGGGGGGSAYLTATRLELCPSGKLPSDLNRPWGKTRGRRSGDVERTDRIQLTVSAVRVSGRPLT